MRSMLGGGGNGFCQSHASPCALLLEYLQDPVGPIAFFVACANNHIKVVETLLVRVVAFAVLTVSADVLLSVADTLP